MLMFSLSFLFFRIYASIKTTRSNHVKLPSILVLILWCAGSVACSLCRPGTYSTGEGDACIQVQLLMKEQVCMTKVLQAVTNARFVLLGPIQLPQVTQFGLLFVSSIGCFLLSDFVVNANASKIGCFWQRRS
jgi:hypothetical protein